ncbi:MAG: cytochrome c biogenesis protein [Thermoanaerobaculia bacterium]|nr:cytochrome c biogenesis protein [Thermoanaerobaculia bacterium]
MTLRRIPWEHWFGGAGLALLLIGSYIGLFVAPPERYMGEVQRIMYVHLPCAWVSMVCFTAAFASAIGSLWTGGKKWDGALVGAIEAGVVLNVLLLIQGIVWGRATWWEGTDKWWTWDVRLTTSLLMCLLFAGVLALRAFVEDRERKASWSAVATIVAYVDVPLVYFCVRWMRSLHQPQSSPETVSSLMVTPLRINSFAVLFIAIWFIARRARIELMRRQMDEVPLPRRLTPQESAGG